MKLIVHVTIDNVTKEEGESFYKRITAALSQFANAHVNGSVVDVFEGSHHTGMPTQEGEI